MNTYYIETFGCQMNELDSEKVAGLLAKKGMNVSRRMQDADFILFNTCSVREKAVQKVLSRLGELKGLKKERPQLVVGVLGCVAQQEGRKLIEQAPVVDFVTGPQKLYRIPSMLDAVLEGEGPVVDTAFEKGPVPVEIDDVLRENAFRAKITIQEGCDKFCSFCIVPFTRGREKNRPSDRIIKEIETLVRHGYVEVLLLGQNVNSYRDPSARGLTFAQLLAEIGSIPGLRRVRFTSPHPSDFDEEIVRVINELPTLCNQVHLPLQSGSNRVLLSMNRGYTREEYLDRVAVIEKYPRKISISTDLIVGFPEEYEVDFQATLDVMSQVRYNQVFSFMYSERPFTAASRRPDPISTPEKKRRLQILQEHQKNIQLALNHHYLNKSVEVLVEGPSRTGELLVGRTTENVCVNFRGSSDMIGKMVDVFIVEAHTNSLKGEWVPDPEQLGSRPVTAAPIGE